MIFKIKNTNLKDNRDIQNIGIILEKYKIKILFKIEIPLTSGL